LWGAAEPALDAPQAPVGRNRGYWVGTPVTSRAWRM